MSWASRRRATYTFGFILFFVIVLGVPLSYWYFTIPTSCFDGLQNQGESAIDKGGPCMLLDERTLAPHAILWTRAFPVRDGSYGVIAYVENPNEGAGVLQAPYRFKLYDDRNILVAEREGIGFIMPGNVTPIYEGAIETGSRKVSRAYLEFSAPLVWERLKDASNPITVLSKEITDTQTTPRLTATIQNTSVADFRDIQFTAVIFDTAGNAFAGSSTEVPLLNDGERMDIVFTWPDRFEYVAGRIDVLPVVSPSATK